MLCLQRSKFVCGRSAKAINADPFIRTSKTSKRRKEEQKMKAPHLITTNKYLKRQENIGVRNALTFFDDHYLKTFGKEKWASMRLALLSRPKHAALINNFADAEETKGFLADEGCFSIKDKVMSQLNELVVDDEGEEEEVGERVDMTRPERGHLPDEDDESHDGEQIPSLPLEEAKDRLIHPDEEILAGSNAATNMYNFVPPAELKGLDDDFADEDDYFRDSSGQDIPIPFNEKVKISYPGHLDAFVYQKADFSRFPQPKPQKLKTYNYYCMDLASVLPVVALDIRPGCSILDLCSGPGGKALAALQTLMPERILCCDLKADRLLRVRHVMEMHLGQNLQKELQLKVDFLRCDGTEVHVGYAGCFDRVLCDVPCFTDRHVLHVEDNNLFRRSRLKERLHLPQLQTDLLVSAIKCLKVGGSAVYSTCTLSPMQNDGVVRSALTRIWEETNIEYRVDDLSGIAGCFQDFFTTLGRKENVQYGRLIVPNILNNFGPIYVAKISRTK